MMSANTEDDLGKKVKSIDQKMNEPIRMNKKSPYYGPLLFIYLKAAIGLALGIFRNHPLAQILIYSFCCVLLFIGALNISFKRKFYRLNAIIAVSTTLLNSIILAMYHSTAAKQLVVGMILIWSLSMLTMLVVTMMQLLVNCQNMIKILKSFPTRIHKMLSKLPESSY